MGNLTDAERVYVEALKVLRNQLMDLIMGLDDTIAEIQQAADSRSRPGWCFVHALMDCTVEH